MRRPHAQAGFSLIEVLVTLAIVAIVAGLVVIGLSGVDGSRRLQAEAERLQQHINFACEGAVLNGRSVGLVADGTRGYRFLARIGGLWQPLKQVAALAPHALPADVHMELQREGQALDDADEEGSPTLRPQIACLPSGEMTPFRIVLRASGTPRRYILEGHIDMQTELHHETPAR